MYCSTFSYALNGIDALQIEIETDVKRKLSKFMMVGLPSNSVKESKNRVFTAIQNTGFKFKHFNYTVNLAPADVKKEGVALDLPIAVSILAATQQINTSRLDDYAIVGELALDGTLRPIKGVLPMALGAWRDGLKGLILPSRNAQEAAVIDGLDIIPVDNLNETAGFLEEKIEIEPTQVDLDKLIETLRRTNIDMFDVKGQYQVKRAIEVAAAGSHNILMLGPPGSGKTMIARRIPTILPSMELKEALETTKIHSVSGLRTNFRDGIVAERPFRTPHHTISDVALIGGGSYPKPGEVSLAHNGVLFLDELPEFKKSVLEVLRQPMEDEIVTISRASQTLSFPAKFMMVASMNPCPCGYYGTEVKGHECACNMNQVKRYRHKISGPLLDRIDIHVEVPAVEFQDLNKMPEGETSGDIRDRVNQARQIQIRRFEHVEIFSNSQMNAKLIRKFCRLDKESSQLLSKAMENIGLSARAYDRILKVARTIADLDESDNIESQHISEAVQYRNLDRKYWE